MLDFEKIEELLAKSELLKQQVIDIEDQLLQAKQRMNEGKIVDQEWYCKAVYTLKKKKGMLAKNNLKINMLYKRAKEEKRQEAENKKVYDKEIWLEKQKIRIERSKEIERQFANLCKEKLSSELFEELMNEAMSRAEVAMTVEIDDMIEV